METLKDIFVVNGIIDVSFGNSLSVWSGGAVLFQTLEEDRTTASGLNSNRVTILPLDNQNDFYSKLNHIAYVRVSSRKLCLC